MRRLAVIALLLAAAATLSSCSALEGALEPGGIVERVLLAGSDETVADKRFEAVLDAVVSKDAEAIKAMFSKKALAEAGDIDASTGYLFGLIQGDVVSWEDETRLVSESVRGGKLRRKISAWYALTTTEGTYTFFFVDYSRDEIEPDNQGLYALRAYRDGDGVTQGGDSGSMKIPGVYMPAPGDMVGPVDQKVPEDEAADAQLEELLAAVEAKDGEALKAMFSKEALKRGGDIDAGIGYLFELVQGDIVSWERKELEPGRAFYTNRGGDSLEARYSLTTTEDAYTVYFTYYYGYYEGYTLVLDAEGLCALRVYRDADAATQAGEWPDIEDPGIYIPEQ